MDDSVYRILNQFNLKDVTLISLKDFESPALLQVKKERTPTEYCWTCKPPLFLYILERWPDIETLTYLDGDLYFFSNPDPIYHALGDRSVLVTPHYYSPEYRKSQAGLFNAGFLLFKNNLAARIIIEEYTKQCLDWCFNYYQKGKIGDQGYLDAWPIKYADHLSISKYRGINVAPWNVNQYKITITQKQLIINREPLVFYHFHSLKVYSAVKFLLSTYPLTRQVKKIIYQPYIESIKRAVVLVLKIEPTFSHGFSPWPIWRKQLKCSLLKCLKKIKSYYYVAKTSALAK
ncbi:MAG TPA: hypothetical protein DDX47_00405 [Candidatus Jacksonbacteria bacterium]|nr:MAG: hypothetical protein A2295_02350 [Candidatus Jacksonbacteria bacterium RIFOXYB2_FULL_44_15]OGY76840.1 MAG: hypothetical protein A2240_04685 [Candidatus Jacksonbacteria bacterium RIFOXYA2_FULL_43_12]OGY82199.1 MAG: hypothetical protein A2550_05855 [Candidatus Jacksonbacteria bacterium RIFOXYD2_FULL_43_21]HBH45817.1 hypothetical protein [Candidatus Jacksonbacteria bacterium]HCC50479.1 hypothetical protein [Candidatus Jacksonbacteria bacterium]